jgi:predicted NBD/HSP70 family sugar kinase
LGPHPRGPLVAVAAVAHETWTVTTVQLGGEMLGAERRRHDRRWDTVSTGVQDALTTSCARYGARISAVVVSVPGTVSGTRLIQASNLGWEHVELSALAPSTGLRLPFFAGNDASFSAIAESRRGAALGTGTALHLYMDSGIGGALISAGALVAGAHGMAGEFGHMPFGQRNVRCRCGARGCWNTGLDGLALARELGQPAPADDVSFSRTVFDAARAGARAERRAVQRAASALGTGTAGLVNALDPEIVTFGGLAQELLEVDGPRVERAYREGLMSTRVEHPPGLARSAIGEHAPLIGAGERGFDHVLSGSALASWRSA